MELCLGVVIGVGVAWLMRRLRKKRPTRCGMAHKQRQHEYHNFLYYNGEQQEDYHGD